MDVLKPMVAQLCTVGYSQSVLLVDPDITERAALTAITIRLNRGGFAPTLVPLVELSACPAWLQTSTHALSALPRTALPVLPAPIVMDSTAAVVSRAVAAASQMPRDTAMRSGSSGCRRGGCRLRGCCCCGGGGGCGCRGDRGCCCMGTAHLLQVCNKYNPAAAAAWKSCCRYDVQLQALLVAIVMVQQEEVNFTPLNPAAQQGRLQWESRPLRCPWPLWLARLAGALARNSYCRRIAAAGSGATTAMAAAACSCRHRCLPTAAAALTPHARLASCAPMCPSSGERLRNVACCALAAEVSSTSAPPDAAAAASGEGLGLRRLQQRWGFSVALLRESHPLGGSFALCNCCSDCHQGAGGMTEYQGACSASCVWKAFHMAVPSCQHEQL